MIEYKAENLGVIGLNPIQSDMRQLSLIKLLIKIISQYTSCLFFFNKKQHSLQDACFLNQQILHYITIYFKNSINFSNFSLVEILVYDLLIFKIIVYIYNNNGSRLIILTIQFKNSRFKLRSIDNLYYNASWLEREVSEFFNLNILNKKDNRNLLLVYGDKTYPLLKEKNLGNSFNFLFSLRFDLTTTAIYTA